jgi:hypothetical protein
MDKTLISQIIRDNRKAGVSLNAISQAIRIQAAEQGVKITKRQFLSDILGVGQTRTSSGRYWEGTYNIAPWESRSLIARDNATGAAIGILRAL